MVLTNWPCWLCAPLPGFLAKGGPGMARTSFLTPPPFLPPKGLEGIHIWCFRQAWGHAPLLLSFCVPLLPSALPPSLGGSLFSFGVRRGMVLTSWPCWLCAPFPGFLAKGGPGMVRTSFLTPPLPAPKRA